jgi:hypothetical protein
LFIRDPIVIRQLCYSRRLMSQAIGMRASPGMASLSPPDSERSLIIKPGGCTHEVS